MDRAKQVGTVAVLSHAIIECVQECGATGAPGGVLYAALMAVGMTFEQFTKLMSTLESLGAVIKTGDCYFAGPLIEPIKRYNEIIMARNGFPMVTKAQTRAIGENLGFLAKDVGVA